MSNHIISPEHHGTWIVASFVIALLAFMLAGLGLYQVKVVLYGTQIEVMALNKKIETMAAAKPAAPAVAEASAAAPK